MPWVNLGTVALDDWEWHSFNAPVIEGSVFRVTHNYAIAPYGYAYISSVFADGSRYQFRKIYPHSDARIIQLPLSENLIQAGLTVRYLSARRSNRVRVFDQSNWTVTLEYFEPETG